MKITELNKKLNESMSYDQIFKVVKASVEKSLRCHRAGLNLILANIPNHIVAYHSLGSNSLVMNRTLLNIVKSRSETHRELNIYLYLILMHEYLHSLGITDEREVRILVKKVASESLGSENFDARMANGDLWSLYPEFRLIEPGKVGENFKIIKDFDLSSTTYIR